jgi:hypothetical protein
MVSPIIGWALTTVISGLAPLKVKQSTCVYIVITTYEEENAYIHMYAIVYMFAYLATLCTSMIAF